MHKAWSSIEEMPYCFSRSSVKFQGHTALKIVECDPHWAFPDCKFAFTDGFEMMHKAWCIIEEVPYYFSGSSIAFRGHTGWKIDDSNPIWERLLSRSQLSNPSDLLCFITVIRKCFVNLWYFLSVEFLIVLSKTAPRIHAHLKLLGNFLVCIFLLNLNSISLTQGTDELHTQTYWRCD